MEKTHLKFKISIITLSLVAMVVIIGSNKQRIWSNNLLADVLNFKTGYTCDRYSGLCIVDKYAAEYSSEKDCLNICPDLRFKWYCNKTIGQCTHDFRGIYNNLDTCQVNCFGSQSTGLDQYKDYSGYTCNYSKGECILTKTNAEFQATTLEDSHYNCIYNCAPELDQIIKNDYAYRNGGKMDSFSLLANPKEHACFNHLNEKGDTCYSDRNCTIRNNICANNHTNDPVSGWIEESTCKNNGWYWLGSYKDYLYKQLCICRGGKCTATQPNIIAYCGNHTCEEWEKYKYIHGNGSISTKTNRYYCPSDCN